MHFIKRLLPLALLILFSQQTGAQLNMQEVSQDIDLSHAMDSWEVGVGISFQDFNNDGWDDITIGTEKGRPLVLYANDRGTLNRIPSIVNNLENVRQVLWTDYDNDGDKDLYISAYDGISKLYKQGAGFVFKDVTTEVNLPTSPQRAIGATWGDVNRDGWLDLYYSIRKNSLYGFEESQNRLFLNLGGSFEEVSDSYNVRDRGRAPFCASFIDVNNDLWPDIYIANDRSKRNTLYLNSGEGAYNDISESSNAGLFMDAMCVTPSDINDDQNIDIYIANTGGEGNKLLINESQIIGEPSFLEKAVEYNLTYNHTAWSSVFFDGDNDGDLDLFVSGTRYISSDFSSYFYENEKTKFEIQNQDALIGKASFASARGDLNNDGLIDMLVQINPPDSYQFWSNKSSSGFNFIKLDLEGVISNREGIGCHVRLYANDKILYKQTYSNTGYLGQDSDIIHFGMGSQTFADSIVINWPTGHVDRFYNVETGTTHHLKEGASTESIYIDDEIEIYSEITVATKENYQSSHISIFPNPTFDIISIEGTEPIEKIEILSSIGAQIQRIDLSSQLSIEISLSQLKPGLYIAKIWTAQKSYSKVVVKL